ncbi:MAG: lasso RiPP family leader peptide-containing protein [Chloroflexi bacterium]|nr:lasso RiPP family leader peptide-containing protein [Chloroflexota bacterium]
MDAQQKREYRAPRLVEYGRVEEITRGPVGSSPDWFWGHLHSGGDPGHGTSS